MLADWATKKVGDGWITDLPVLEGLKKYATDKKAQKEFMDIKYKNKVRLAEYIKEHNGIDVDPNSIFDVQVKRLHEYKRQQLNILHVMHLYNELKANPDMDFEPTTFIFGAKAAAGYKTAKLTIKLINSVADVTTMISLSRARSRLYSSRTTVYQTQRSSSQQQMYRSRSQQLPVRLPVQVT